MGSSAGFELLSQIASAQRRNVVHDGIGDQAAAVAFGGNPIQRPHGFFRQVSSGTITLILTDIGDS